MDFPASIKTKKVPHSSSTVTIYFPVIYDLQSPNAQYNINKAIIMTLNNMLIEQNYYNPDLVEMVAYFEIKNNQRGILSLNIIIYAYTGGAHGMTLIKSLTFDTKSGQQFTLNELFKPGSDYEKEINGIIQKDIVKWNISVLDKFPGIRPDQDFYIADTSIVIYFQLYEISPYVQGFPYFPIPILDLAAIIKPEGPLDTMMRFT